MRRLFLRSSLIVCFFFPAFGQEAPSARQESITGAVLKNRAPVSKDILRVKLPRAYQEQLENGLTVLIVENHELPTVYFSLNIRGAGGIYDAEELPGVASMVASLLRQGTGSRTADEISEEIDEMGGSLNAGAGFTSESATASASGLVEDTDRLLELLGDIVLHPVFPQEEVDKYGRRQLTLLQQQRSSPFFLVSEKMARVLYGDHPAGRISHTRESLEKISREDLLEFHGSRYGPQGAILGVAGDVTRSEILVKIRKTFGPWEGEPVGRHLPQPAELGAAKIHLVDRPGSVQTNLSLGNLALDRAHADYIPLTVMNRILGGGPTGRLFLNLREEKGYTYGAYSSVSALRYRGSLTASAAVRTEVTEESLAEFLKEFRSLREELVSERQHEDARRAMVASFALSLESPQNLLNNAIISKIYGFPGDYWDTYPEKIMAVSREQIREMAQKYIDLDHLQIVAVGDGSKIKEKLEKHGTVAVYDTEGKLVTTPQ